MPKKAAQLRVWLRGFSLSEKPRKGSRSEVEAEVKDALREFDFSIFETSEPSDGRQIHTYPFEDRKKNVRQIDEFVQYLEQKYTDADVMLSDEGSLGKPGRELPAQQFYMITVESGDFDPEEIENNKSYSSDIEWRDLDTDSVS